MKPENMAVTEYWILRIQEDTRKETAKQIAALLRDLVQQNDAVQRRIWSLSSAAVEIEEKFGLRESPK